MRCSTCSKRSRFPRLLAEPCSAGAAVGSEQLLGVAVGAQAPASSGGAGGHLRSSCENGPRRRAWAHSSVTRALLRRPGPASRPTSAPTSAPAKPAGTTTLPVSAASLVERARPFAGFGPSPLARPLPALGSVPSCRRERRVQGGGSAWGSTPPRSVSSCNGAWRRSPERGQPSAGLRGCRRSRARRCRARR